MKTIAIVVFVLGLMAACCGQTATPTETEDSVAVDSVEVVDSVLVDSLVD